MKAQDFKRWRKALHLSQKDAAEVLGLKRRVVQYYEKGERDGETVTIPRSVRLACYAIWLGVGDYNGPVPGEDAPKDVTDRIRHSLSDKKTKKSKSPKTDPETP